MVCSIGNKTIEIVASPGFNIASAEIKIRTQIVVASSSQAEKAKKLIGFAENNCPILNFLRCEGTFIRK